MINRAYFTPRAVLAQNLKALMKANPALASQNDLKQKSGVAQATIGRILRESGENARVETIERLARAFDLELWQILVPGMDPKNPPVLVPINAAERQLYENLKKVAQDMALYGHGKK